MAAVLKKKALAEYTANNVNNIEKNNSQSVLLTQSLNYKSNKKVKYDYNVKVNEINVVRVSFTSKCTIEEQLKVILDSNYIYGSNISEDIVELFKHVLKDPKLVCNVQQLLQKLLVTIHEEEECIIKASYFCCIQELIKIKNFEENVCLIKLIEDLIPLISIFDDKLITAEILCTIQKIIEKPSVKVSNNINQILINLVKQLLSNKKSHLVKSRCLIFLSKLAPINFSNSNHQLNNLDSMNQQTECLNIIKILRDYSKYFDSRVRSSALFAILQLHKRGFKLDISLYCEFCDALKDDYEGCRVEAIKLLEVLSNYYSDCLVCVDKGDEQIRLIDDAFAKICSMINDLSVNVRTQAGIVLGNFKTVSSDFLEQTLDKKLMSNLKLKKSAHERNRESCEAGEWSSGKKWADDAPQGEIQPDSVTLMNIGACGAFIHGLEDEFMHVRMATLESISKLAEYFPNFAKQSLDFLVDMLNDEIEDIRLLAINCLGKICQKNLVLRDDQIEIILPVLKDSSFVIRESLHLMLGKCKLSSKLSLKSCIDNLLENLKRYPEDKSSIWKSFQMFGKNNAEFISLLVHELLGIHSFLDLQEPSLDDYSYIGILILIVNAAVTSKEIINLFEQYNVFSKHYTYLRDLTPELVPVIKELDKDFNITNDFVLNNDEKKKNKNMEIFLLNVFDRMKNSIDSNNLSLERQSTIIKLSINDLQKISSIEKSMSNATEFAKYYLECQMLLRSILNNNNWINAFLVTSLQSSSFRSSLHQILVTTFKLIHQFHGLHPIQLVLVYEIRVKALALQLIAVIHGSNASALTLCDAFLEEVFLLKKTSENFNLSCDELSLTIISEISNIKEPKPGSVARVLKPLFLSPSKTLKDTSYLTQLISSEVKSNFKLCNLKKSFAIIEWPKDRTETPLKFTSGLILTIKLDAKLYNIKDIKYIRLKIHFADKQTSLVLPRLSDFRLINEQINNEYNNENKIKKDILDVNNYRLQTNVYISHGIWSEPCFVELSLVLDFRESLSSALSVSQTWSLKSTPGFKIKSEESLMIELSKPVKLLISPKPHKKDSFERRPLEQERVIGTLLGQNEKNGNIEITNCFVVQHSEGNGEVAINIEVARELCELHKKVNNNETIVGWFATGITDFTVNEYSVVIHDYYSRETKDPIHLTVNPCKSGINIKAFIATPFGVPKKTPMGIMFSPIKNVSIVGGYETELIGLKACMLASNFADKAVTSSFDSEVDMILSACKKSKELISLIVKFIDEDILNGVNIKNIPVNSNLIGRQLMSMVESVIPLKDDDGMLNTNLKDFLMVIYLSNLAKTQLMLNEKLSNW